MKTAPLAALALLALTVPASAQRRKPTVPALDELIAMDAQASAADPVPAEKKKEDPPKKKDDAKAKAGGEAKDTRRICPRDCVWVKPLMGEEEDAEVEARRRAFMNSQVTNEKP